MGQSPCSCGINKSSSHCLPEAESLAIIISAWKWQHVVNIILDTGSPTQALLQTPWSTKISGITGKQHGKGDPGWTVASVPWLVGCLGMTVNVWLQLCCLSLLSGTKLVLRGKSLICHHPILDIIEHIHDGRAWAAAATKSLQSCPTLHNPIDCSPPGSTIPGILQARTLEWVAISFSNA